MKLSKLLYSIFIFSGSIAAIPSLNLTDVATLIPTCAIGCIITGIPSLPAVLADPASTCSNTTLQASLSSCIQGACNFTEQAEVATFTQKLCSGVPIESRSKSTTVVGLVFGPLAIFAVIFRCYSRYSITKKLEYDDLIIIAAALAISGLIVTDVKNCANGFGRHLWNINPALIAELLKVFWISEFLYIIAITLIKVSILLFYLRIFPSKSFWVIDSIVMASVIAFGFAISLVVVFQCKPVSGAWDRLIHSKCVNINALAYATGSISITQDVVILILPIPQLVSLKMNIRKKLNLLFMFSLGIIACITSIVRLKYIVAFGDSRDPTFDNAIPAIWSLVEVSIATICACLPAMRYLLARCLPMLFDINSTKRSKSNARSNPLSNPFSSATSGKRNQYDKISLSSNSHPIVPRGLYPLPKFHSNGIVTKIRAKQNEVDEQGSMEQGLSENHVIDNWDIADGMPLQKVKLREERMVIDTGG